MTHCNKIVIIIVIYTWVFFFSFKSAQDSSANEVIYRSTDGSNRTLEMLRLPPGCEMMMMQETRSNYRSNDSLVVVLGISGADGAT